MTRIPSYRLHRASGQAIVAIAGREIYLGKHGTADSRLRYKRIVAEWLASDCSPCFGAPKKQITVVEVLSAYVKHAKSYYGNEANSEFQDVKLAVRRIKELYRTEIATDFGGVHFKTIRQQMIADGLSRGYINEVMRRITRIFRWAAAEGLVSPDVYRTLEAIDGLKLGRTKAKEGKGVKPVDEEIVLKTIPLLPEVVQDMVRLHSLIGCRPSELCGIRLRMVDRQSDVWLVRMEKHKNVLRGKTRTLYMGPQAQKILLPYLDRQPDDFLFVPKESEKRRRTVVSENRTTPLEQGDRVGTNRKKYPKRSPGNCFTRCDYTWAFRIACINASNLLLRSSWSMVLTCGAIAFAQ